MIKFRELMFILALFSGVVSASDSFPPDQMQAAQECAQGLKVALHTSPLLSECVQQLAIGHPQDTRVCLQTLQQCRTACAPDASSCPSVCMTHYQTCMSAIPAAQAPSSAPPNSSGVSEQHF